MVVTSTDLVLRLSGGASNCNPHLSLGGQISTATCGVIGTNVVQNVFDNVSNTDLIQSIIGTYNYRCIYLVNANPSNETLQYVSIWIEQNTQSPFTDIEIGLGISGVGELEQTIPDEYTPPKFVAWDRARSEDFAVFIGNIAPNQWKAIWIRRRSGPAPSGTSYPNDNYLLKYKCLRDGIPGPPSPVPPPTPPPPGVPAPPPTPPPTPTPPPPPPPGTPSPPPPPPMGDDQFGVRKIYPDAIPDATLVSTPFYLAANAANDCRFDPVGTISQNPDGSWRHGTMSRMKMFSSVSSGCAKTVISSAVTNLDTYNHSIWATRGYIWRPNDWKSIEVTGYFKIVDATGTSLGGDAIEFQIRGVNHTTSVANGCGGPDYESDLFDDGRLAWEKEQFHNEGVECGSQSVLPKINTNVGSLRSKWFGYKLIAWNYIEPGTGVKAVHLECWLDPTATNTWQKVSEKNDTGGWYAGMPNTSCNGDEFCGGTQDQINTWGSPIIDINWNTFREVHFKWLSIREIIPPNNPLPPPPPPTSSVKLSVSSVTAKGFDTPTPPTNAIDGSLSTRWSHQPVPTWIRLNLGSVKVLTGIKIAWYNGDTRRMGFRIDCENGPGSDVVTAFSGTSSGTTTQLETYDFSTLYARQYVTIHVLSNSSAGNLWASITEVEVYGTSGTVTPPPPNTPPSPPPTSPEKDIFGTNKIYSTDPSTQEWSATAWGNGRSRTIRDVPVECTPDPFDSRMKVDRAGGPLVTINGSGIMRASTVNSGGGSPRIVVLGTWQNVESTVYMRCPSSSLTTTDVSLRSKTDHYCVSTGDFGGYIHNVFFNTQGVGLRKERSHTIGYSTRQALQALTLPANTWIGVKAICYTLPNGHVKLETYIDTTDGANGGNWVLRTQATDDGTWDGAGGGLPIQTDPSGGSAMRIDLGVTGGYIELKKWTVREINPPSS